MIRQAWVVRYRLALLDSEPKVARFSFELGLNTRDGTQSFLESLR